MTIIATPFSQKERSVIALQHIQAISPELADGRLSSSPCPALERLAMLMTPMRVFPSLFVGRRSLIEATEVEALEPGRPGVAFTCGACDAVIHTAESREAVADVVVKGRCGEYNQL
jgi:hypothetical protein